MAAKKHHYVPEAYLKHFADGEGFIWVGRKDDPENPHRMKPGNIAFRKYYYSQIGGEGERDDRLEDHLGTYETPWPGIVSKLKAKGRLSPNELNDLWSFMAVQRARVPAARDAMESMLAHHSMIAMRELEESGELPAPPKEHSNLIDQVRISVHPQKSIEAMSILLRGVHELRSRLNLIIVHNVSDIGFITSDNPIAVFDPSYPEHSLRPYFVEHWNSPIELLFPIDSNTLIRGLSKSITSYCDPMPRHVELGLNVEIKRINRLVAKFGYEILIAKDGQNAKLLKAHAEKSPIIENAIGWSGGKPAGRLRWGFGPRPKKPKWSD
jgi:hypothetical protein